jgi:hypothetical protein
VATFKEEAARPPCGETTKADAVERKKAGRNNFMVVCIVDQNNNVNRTNVIFYLFI